MKMCEEPLSWDPETLVHMTICKGIKQIRRERNEG